MMLDDDQMNDVLENLDLLPGTATHSSITTMHHKNITIIIMIIDH